MASTYIVHGADTSALTGPPTLVSTNASTTPKTILQVLNGAKKIRIKEWGYLFGTVPTVPIAVELVETGSVAATVTSIGNGVRTYGDVTGPASVVNVSGTTATGFNATAEGAITTSRLLGFTYDTGYYFKQPFADGFEPEVGVNSILRMRFTLSSGTTAIGVAPYIIWEE